MTKLSKCHNCVVGRIGANEIREREWPEPKDGEPRLHIKEAANSPVIQDGWALVPVEPTELMINAWLSEVANWRGHVAGYKAALAAATGSA